MYILCDVLYCTVLCCCVVLIVLYGAQTSGGDHAVCATPCFPALQRRLEELAARLVHVFHAPPLVSVALHMPQQGQRQEQRQGQEQVEVSASLLVARAGEWPLPESK